MIGVVLRCPTCGTTQSRPGECEACSEGEVRYFCTNHTPGLWADGPVCSACGAKFGDAPKTRPPAIPRSAPTAPARRRPSPDPPVRAPRRDRRPDSRPRTSPPRVAEDEDVPPVPSLAEAIVDMLEEGRRSRGATEEVVWREPPADTPRSAFPVMGCLGRLLMFVLLLIALGFGGLLLMFGGLS